MAKKVLMVLTSSGLEGCGGEGKSVHASYRLDQSHFSFPITLSLFFPLLPSHLFLGHAGFFLAVRFVFGEFLFHVSFAG